MGSESSLQSVKKRSSYAKRRVRIQGPKDSFVRVRFDAASRRLLDCKAAAAHMTLSDYVRHTVQGPGGPRPRRKPPVEVVQLARTLAALGKLGGNINQMAHIANINGNLPAQDILELIADILKASRRDLLKALGRDH